MHINSIKKNQNIISKLKKKKMENKKINLKENKRKKLEKKI